MKITIPELSLVVLIGPSGSGKSSFGRKLFLPTEVVSSDECRGLVSDNENEQAATNDAFDLLHTIVRKRLGRGRLTLIDATNVQPEARKSLVELAREYHVLPVAIVFDLPEKLCQERNVSRPDRQFGPHVIRNQAQQMRRSLRGLEREGFRYVFKLSSPEEVDAVTIERQPLWNNRRDVHGPFDIVGDVHGCLDELLELMATLGYEVVREDAPSIDRQDAAFSVVPPDGRKLVFVGDLVDRGPATPDVLRLAMTMVHAGQAFCVPGNHDMKLMKALKGRDVQLTHGLAESLQQLEKEPAEFRAQALKFLDDLVSHYIFDDGKLVVAHAGMKESMQGRGSAKVRDFALYGETTGETDDLGLPVRYNWSADYRGKALVVYGHTPVPEPLWLNGTVNIDTGCVFGGRLTALRYPEREIVSVPAKATYYESRKPFLPNEELAPRAAQHAADDVLDIDDVIGKRLIDTRLLPRITVREENAIAALEVMSRFAVDPKWLIYLPPTMSPSETSKLPGLLEHPQEAFTYYRHEGVPRVICEQKHMGSRAVVILCRDEAVSVKRFGVIEPALGVVYTRTGRRFFNETTLEKEFLARIQEAADRSGLWDELGTDWMCLDCELMPWSVKAQELLTSQYAPVAAAGTQVLLSARTALASATTRIDALQELAKRTEARLESLAKYREAYGHYCWPVRSIDDLKLAPFHLLATEGSVHTDKQHGWHMEKLTKLCAQEEKLLLATPSKIVDVNDTTSCDQAAEWWQALTSAGGEGMVVKPLDFISKGRRGYAQPAVKCRGPEYLRIIYGPEYLIPENLERLRSRGLGAKRSLANREFALGVEALERFVRKEPLRRTHECVFGVLALESEPVDPRL
jgi:protein phosphatase